MGPVRVEVKDSEGEWQFASYAYGTMNLAELLNVIFCDSEIRVFEGGSLVLQRGKPDKKGMRQIKDYRIN